MGLIDIERALVDRSFNKMKYHTILEISKMVKKDPANTRKQILKLVDSGVLEEARWSISKPVYRLSREYYKKTYSETPNTDASSEKNSITTTTPN
jgi:hypothetical protein